MSSWSKKYDIYHRENIASLREHYKRKVLSPDKQYKAQIYFEYDCQNSSTYVDFTDKKGELINRVRFTPTGWSVICKAIGCINWINNKTIKIFDIQVDKNYKDADCNTKYYWFISINGIVEYKLTDNQNPHLIFQLGKKLYEGKVVLEDKEKGLSLIKQSADMNYKHAINWLKRN